MCIFRAQNLEKEAGTGAMFVMPAFEAPRCIQPQCADGVADGLAASGGSKANLHAMFKAASINAFRE